MGRPEVDRAGDRQAAKLHKEWLDLQVRMVALLNKANHLIDTANAVDVPSVRDWTPAQAEAEGWCGSCWRINVNEPIPKRDTGEPWYRGRCLWCARWKDENGESVDPPLHALKEKRLGKTVMVKA